MRRVRKKKMTKNCEAHFLKRRRAAVDSAAEADTSPASKPAWLRDLSKKLWTKSHASEREFNRKKHAKKALLAYKSGMYKPGSQKKKRKMEEKLQEFHAKEAKRRKVYDRSIEKRYQAARKP